MPRQAVTPSSPSFQGLASPGSMASLLILARACASALRTRHRRKPSPCPDRPHRSRSS
ncbi:Hypothetical protein AA314_10040 [Archangium gephyra]|uniref:Uncharacterized protein n=1 Tax=Archangium gephyra TaxID=48 RepID=A0AAC8QJ58_9BACT|nr:Hypothetical protein AA314_10040 [Archangium gephyra]